MHQRIEPDIPRKIEKPLNKKPNKTKTMRILRRTAIYYKNGEPFKGSVSFTVSGLGVSISDWTHTINGQTYFHLSSPVFKKGPGIYSIKPGWIYDSKGFIIASGQETDKFSLDIEAR